MIMGSLGLEVHHVFFSDFFSQHGAYFRMVKNRLKIGENPMDIPKKPANPGRSGRVFVMNHEIFYSYGHGYQL